MTAASAIAAIGAAKFDIGFASERGAPISAMAGFDIYLGLIEEFHRALIGDDDSKSEGSLHDERNLIHADLKRDA